MSASSEGGVRLCMAGAERVSKEQWRAGEVVGTDRRAGDGAPVSGWRSNGRESSPSAVLEGSLLGTHDWSARVRGMHMSREAHPAAFYRARTRT